MHERRPQIGAQLAGRVPHEPDDADLGERLTIVVEKGGRRCYPLIGLILAKLAK